MQHQQPNRMGATNFPMNPNQMGHPQLHQQQMTEMLGNMSLNSSIPNMTQMNYPQQQIDAPQPLYQQP